MRRCKAEEADDQRLYPLNARVPRAVRTSIVLVGIGKMLGGSSTMIDRTNDVNLRLGNLSCRGLPLCSR